MKRLAAPLLVLVLAACGGGSSTDDALDEAQESLLDAEAGAFALSLEGERDEPVGFSVESSFSYETGGYPLVDARFERHLGTDDQTNEFRCDGTTAWVIRDGAVTPVSLGRLQGLRAGEGIAASVPDLDIASWFDEVERDGDTFTGTVDVAELVGDLQRLAAEIDGNQAEDDLDDDAASTLREALESSTIELRTDDGAFRSLTATIDFGDEIPEPIDSGLVSYAASKLELRITLEALDGPLEVEVPGS